MPPAVAPLNYISSGILWRIFSPNRDFRGVFFEFWIYSVYGKFYLKLVRGASSHVRPKNPPTFLSVYLPNLCAQKIRAILPTASQSCAVLYACFISTYVLISILNNHIHIHSHIHFLTITIYDLSLQKRCKYIFHIHSKLSPIITSTKPHQF